MRIKTSLESLNGLSKNKKYNYPFMEENWVNEENKDRICNNESPLEKDGFHFSIHNEDITLWNGKERIYLPLMGVGMKIDDSLSDIANQVERKKEIIKKSYPKIFEKLSMLKINEDQILDLIFPYILKYRNAGNSNRTMYIEGSINNGEITEISVSNYLYCNVGKYSNLINFYYEETNEKQKIEQLMKNFIVKGYDLLYFDDKIRS